MNLSPRVVPPRSSDEQLPSADADATAGAGRGGLALAAGKVFFLVSGLVQQIVLKAILGLAGYGALSTTLSIASIAYNPIVQSGIQGLSRETASVQPRSQAGVVRQLLRFHLGLAVVLSLAFFLLAPILTNVLGAPHIESAVRVLSGVLFLYGIYAPLVGVLNGQRRFLAQAGLDAFAATVRTVGLLGGALVGTRWMSNARSQHGGSPLEPLFFTCAGFVASAFIVLAVAAHVTGWGKEGTERIDRRRYARTLAHIWAGQLLLNVLFQADALLLRRFGAVAATQGGLTASAVDPFVGAYRATQLFCFLPFQLLTSVTFVLFPLLASAHGRGQASHVAHLISRGLRMSLLFTGALLCVIVGCAEGLLTLVFGAETSALATPAMRILALGMGGFALLGVMTSALNSLGLERLSLGLMFAATLLVGSLCSGLLMGSALDASMLVRAALGTSLAMLVATLMAAYLLGKATGGTIHLVSALRTVITAALAAAASIYLLPRGALWTLINAPVTVGCYLLFQVISGELTKEDVHGLFKLIRR